MGFIGDFRDFLSEYKVASIAIAFILGTATTALVTSFVNDMAMPLISPLTKNGSWQSAIAYIGPFALNWGPFLAALLNFVLIVLVVFIIVKLAKRADRLAEKRRKAPARKGMGK